MMEKLKLLNIILAGLLVGWIAHELVHILTMSSVSSITFYFGSKKFISTVCCLQPFEEAFEYIAYTIQAITTVVWVWVSW